MNVDWGKVLPLLLEIAAKYGPAAYRAAVDLAQMTEPPPVEKLLALAELIERDGPTYFVKGS